MKYIVDDSCWFGNHAGPKARNDVNYFLKDWKTVYLIEDRRKGFSSIDAIKGYIKLYKLLNKDDIVLFQWPLLLGGFWQKHPVVHKIGECKKIVLIHDLVSLRENVETSFSKEISILNQFDVVISHNNKMTKWLKENGLSRSIVNLELFDYYAETDRNAETIDMLKPIHSINIAGNLARIKSGYLYNLDEASFDSVEINAYGPNYEDTPKVKYCGSYSPEELPSKIRRGFGLVWDGNSVNCVSGNYGHYMRYNNPHKLSLYIRSGLPVIVWKEAAIAEIVKEFNIGFCIDNLNEIPNVVCKCSATQYEEMLSNVKELMIQVGTGYFINKAIDEALKAIEK